MHNRLSILLKNNKFWLILNSLAVISILSPILYLTCRDGIGNAIFPFHDQLDETILNYVFPARYPGAKVYDQMMCGIPAEGLKPFSPLFVLLYRLFDVYTAFLIQHCIVVITAFFGMFFCVHIITGRYEAAFISAFLFAFLPVHSAYGNVVTGTPLLIYCILRLRRNKNDFVPPSLKSCIGSCAGIVYYGLSTGFALCGWAAVALLLLGGCVSLIIKKKQYAGYFFIPAVILLCIYILLNVDLFIEVFSPTAWVSHREEFGFGSKETSFLSLFWERLSNGSYSYEAESKHEFLIIPILLSVLFLLNKKIRDNHLTSYLTAIVLILAICLIAATMESSWIYSIQQSVPGILKSFQFSRFHYFLPALWYILLGISASIILDFFSQKTALVPIGFVLAAVAVFPAFYSLAKDKDGIFYQNINQINNGEQITGYYTMRNIYSEDLMTTIERAIGKDMKTYRVVNIGISPVASLMHGFNTIDGYSNNYPLEYKHKFREVISGELEKNDYNRIYFDSWGSRCYCFYHEWGNAYMLGKRTTLKINDLCIDTDKLRELNCKYIFSAGEIINCEQYGIKYAGDFENSSSLWHIWVYEVQ